MVSALAAATVAAALFRGAEQIVASGAADPGSKPERQLRSCVVAMISGITTIAYGIGIDGDSVLLASAALQTVATGICWWRIRRP